MDKILGDLFNTLSPPQDANPECSLAWIVTVPPELQTVFCHFSFFGFWGVLLEEASRAQRYLSASLGRRSAHFSGLSKLLLVPLCFQHEMLNVVQGKYCACFSWNQIGRKRTFPTGTKCQMLSTFYINRRELPKLPWTSVVVRTIELQGL